MWSHCFEADRWLLMDILGSDCLTETPIHLLRYIYYVNQWHPALSSLYNITGYFTCSCFKCLNVNHFLWPVVAKSLWIASCRGTALGPSRFSSISHIMFPNNHLSTGFNDPFVAVIHLNYLSHAWHHFHCTTITFKLLPICYRDAKRE